MAKVRFTPAFEGDEYHSASLSFIAQGEYEVAPEWVEYLTTTFSNRFSAVDEPKAKAATEAKSEPKKKAGK